MDAVTRTSRWLRANELLVAWKATLRGQSACPFMERALKGAAEVGRDLWARRRRARSHRSPARIFFCGCERGNGGRVWVVQNVHSLSRTLRGGGSRLAVGRPHRLRARRSRPTSGSAIRLPVFRRGRTEYLSHYGCGDPNVALASSRRVARGLESDATDFCLDWPSVKPEAAFGARRARTPRAGARRRTVRVSG
jgi:hypothetical protein